MNFRILAELLKNSKMSDRKIAKILGVSQPTITRRRARIEKDLIDGYTVIPKWKKLGYEILAFTFVRQCRLSEPEKSIKMQRKKGEIG